MNKYTANIQVKYKQLAHTHAAYKTHKLCQKLLYVTTLHETMQAAFTTKQLALIVTCHKRGINSRLLTKGYIPPLKNADNVQYQETNISHNLNKPNVHAEGRMPNMTAYQLANYANKLKETRSFS